MSTHAPTKTRDNLPLHFHQAIEQLQAAVSRRKAALHTLMLATTNAAGHASCRTVVLRGFDAEAMRVVIHTDLRSPKVEELRGQPRCQLLGYDAEQKMQLRLTAEARVIEQGPEREQQWQQTSAMGRRNYLTTAAPGQPITDPTEVDRQLRLRHDDEGHAHFAVILLQLIELDYLSLSAQGHRRAVFRADARWHGQWCVP